MDVKKLVAYVNSCRQYSPDDFENMPRILEIDEQTTVHDLIEWYNQPRDRETGRLNGGQIHIMEMDGMKAKKSK